MAKPLVKSLLRVLGLLVKSVAGLTLFLAGLVAILLLVMWWEHRTPITLPVPTGPYAVGRATFAWANMSKADELLPLPKSKRQLLVWLWYPATPTSISAPTDYLPGNWRTAVANQEGVFMRSFLKRDPGLVHTHSVSGATVSAKQQTYPVVLLRAGGSALTTDFTTLAEDLASHGFFVVGFDAPYRSFVVVLSDGEVVSRVPAYNVENASGNLADPLIAKLLRMWTVDTTFVVDQLERLNASSSGLFAGRMDLRRLGMFGHSFGGATALEFCREDSRCRSALDMDGIPFGGVVAQGLNKPGMFLLSDHSGEISDPENRQVLSEVESIYKRLPAGSLYVVMRTANHFSFSDQILLNSPAAMKLIRWVRLGRLDGRRGLAISADYVHAFFDVSLNGASASVLTSVAGRYKEVQVEER